jgi:hypothetical protein
VPWSALPLSPAARPRDDGAVRLSRPSVLLRRAPAILCCCAPLLAGCGDDERRAAPVPLQAPADRQVRDVAKAVTQAYDAEDYRRLCAQFAPGTFAEILTAVHVDSCEELFRRAPSFEAPSPQQIDAADVGVRGEQAIIRFAQPGVDPMRLRKVGGRWLIVDEAEITED